MIPFVTCFFQNGTNLVNALFWKINEIHEHINNISQICTDINSYCKFSCDWRNCIGLPTALLKNVALNRYAWRPGRWRSASTAVDGNSLTGVLSGLRCGITENPFFAVDLGQRIGVGNVILQKYSKYILFISFIGLAVTPPKLKIKTVMPLGILV